jgi:general secretion pathway protein I
MTRPVRSTRPFRGTRPFHRTRPFKKRSDRGFTLVEVLVALVVVALGLAALMVAVQGAARTSGYLRDKTLAQWIALNRIAEVRLTANKSSGVSAVTVTSTLSTPTAPSNFGTVSSPNDKGEVQFAGRSWHYDTRYFDTNFPDMKRIVVRVWAGDTKTKGNPVTETTSFYGTSLAQPGLSNTDWTTGTTAASAGCAQGAGAALGGGAAVKQIQQGLQNGTINCTPAAGVPGVQPTLPAAGVTATPPGTTLQ